MSQELLEKLKKAGFPFSKREMERLCAPNSPCRKGGSPCGLCNVTAADSFPTLEELIDAMPMREKYLGTINDAHFVLRKLVGERPYYRAYYEDEDTGEPVAGYEFVAETPSEAVSRLWLALNKKDG